VQEWDGIDSQPQDLVFIRPNDLALALLGYTPANYTEPVFLEAIEKVVASAKKYGKKTGILAVDGEAARKAKERFDVVVMSADVRALQPWYGKELKIARC
jgi:4-hydroxy-2-oxoheptanedioate aldolase